MKWPALIAKAVAAKRLRTETAPALQASFDSSTNWQARLELAEVLNHVDPTAARTLTPVLAAAFDLIGEPAASVHPVVWYGRLIRALESRAPRGQGAQLRYGVIMLLVIYVMPSGAAGFVRIAAAQWVRARQSWVNRSERRSP